MSNLLPPPTPEQLARSFAEIHPPFEPQEAVVEAARCLFCYDAPCSAACPTHIDVPRFIRKIATGNVRGSAMTILESNILGLSCSRVCPVDVLCEGACVMHRYNREPIEIGRLQRRAMDYFYDHGARLAVAAEKRAGRIACIGGGPASLACAAELARQGYSVTVFEARPRAGGLNTYGVAQYKFRPVDSDKEVELVRSLGVEFRTGVEVGIGITLDAIEAEFDRVFIGVGLGPTQALGIDGELLDGVVDAVGFIAEYKTGTPRVGRRVVVVGGGNTAIDAACAAKRLGADEVSLVYRRGEYEMPAFTFEYEHAKKDGIRFLFRTQPVAARGNGAVDRLECQSVELGPPDASGRRAPQPGPGANFDISCDMVILSIGQSKLFRNLAEAKGIATENGRLKVDSATGQTTNRRYYAGGDCVNGGREVVDAVAGGTRAGRAIAISLNG